MLNQHLPGNVAFQVGVHHDKGQRRTMEDAYSFVVDFARVRGQGYFAVFDGHAGKYAAEWCGRHFHEHLIEQLREHPELPIPDVLNCTFHAVDSSLSALAASNEKMHSGCTAVSAFLRIEDANGKQSFIEGLDIGGTTSHDRDRTVVASPAQEAVPYPTPENSQQDPPSPRSDSPEAITPPPDAQLRRVLYTANAGDARAVLCRGGKAVRLTYDHKGSDKQEAKRILDAGGLVISGRVNGILAVTRSLGDSSMKDFVVGAPYTTETELGDDDDFLILACDGVWDVTSDQEAVDMVRNVTDPQQASSILVQHALKESTDNITAIVVRFPSTHIPLS
ncbi:protein serine/threonine phosphatase 2C [Fomitiporia mediterranea MF3/22]|uniref:protein serine/threonine phosphatase 2C n=1 Tax=Fomitiporia mediterranea (strain MF3/22) TaxID=694068 RepID=UPI000440907A|nr:protein serine/threonine phosphatase 2C [Fomitiporia mediterranea MF3/22]EJD03382.1 protein serine/threonine phosphatase 2C [Fomitiporia mediterranea MF3/22]